MTENAYRSPETTGDSKQRRTIGWLITSGLICLAISAICAGLTVYGMQSAFQQVQQSATTPKPSDLASGIQGAMLPALGIAPFGLIGTAMLVAGFLIRPRADADEPGESQ